MTVAQLGGINIGRLVTAYLQKSSMRKQPEEVAKTLVKNRWIRSRDQKWNLVVIGHRYHCTGDECINQGKYYDSMDNLREHLLSEHKLGSEPEVQRGEMIKKGKTLPSGMIYV